MSDNSRVFDDVAQSADHVCAELSEQERVVRQWSNIDTGYNEYQIALKSVLGSLEDGRKIPIDGRLGRDMAVDIVTNSAVNQLLRVNKSEMCIEVRPDAPLEVLQQVRDLILSRTKGGTGQ